MDAGRIVEVGRLPGDFIGADPSGRHVAVQHKKVLTVHDVHDDLAAMASWRVDHQAYDQVAVSPGGNAVVALTKDSWCLELWQTGDETPIRAATEIAGSEAALHHKSFGFGGVGWLQYSADGAYLYFGEAVRDEPARLNLLDPATLVRLDSVSPVGSHAGDESIQDWGEDPQSCCAPSPSTAVAFAANAGDDLVVLGVAEAVDGSLEVHSGRSPSSWVDIPGERGMEMTFLAGDELLMLDSDECLTRIRWKDHPMTVTDLASGSDLLSIDAPTDPETAAALRALVGARDDAAADDTDERLMLVGPMSTSGPLLAMAVDLETWRPGHGSDWETVGLVVVDIGSGERQILRLPEAERTYLSNGTICQRIGSHLQISRWAAPSRR
jgi:hypothetical protein